MVVTIGQSGIALVGYWGKRMVLGTLAVYREAQCLASQNLKSCGAVGSLSALQRPHEGIGCGALSWICKGFIDEA